MPRAFGEHVHDQAAEIEQHPIAAGLCLRGAASGCRSARAARSISSQIASTCGVLNPVQSRK